MAPTYEEIDFKFSNIKGKGDPRNDPLFKKIVNLTFAAYLHQPYIDPKSGKKVTKDLHLRRMCKRYQERSKCKSTINVMRRIRQYPRNTHLAVIETYKLLVSGDY